MNVWRLAPLLLIITACESPSGSGYAPPETKDASVLFPDLVDADAEEDTAVDTAADTTQPDTTQPDTTPPDTTQPDTSPPDTTACVEGSGCDDNDRCTVNDRCQSGVCRGDALVCNDNLPCTADQCVGGVCQHPVTTGCLIGNTCYSENQPQPNNPCFACEPPKTATGWSPQNGSPCNDNNACTANDTCQAGTCVGGAAPPEVCSNGMDDDCNGKTDTADLACGGVTPCTYHTDCYPERLCATWSTTGQKRCSDPCSGDGDCGIGKICSKVPGSAQVGFCQDAPPGNTIGQACTLDTQCSSGLCTDNICTPLCLDEAACTFPNVTCHPVGYPAQGILQSTCSPDPQGSIGLGNVCSTDGINADGGLCASGHCDLLSSFRCSPLCRSEADCPAPMECNIVIAAPTERFDAIPASPSILGRTTDTITACFTPNSTSGSRADGTSCTSNAQCSSNKCMPVGTNGQTVCTSFCTTNAQCPATMICALSLVDLVSDWLNAAGQSRRGVFTLVRSCQYP